MNVLDREFSKKFDDVFTAALQNCDSIQFRPSSQHPNPYLARLKGGRATEQKNGKRIVVIYLREDLKDEEMELVAVHELCHEIIRNQGFDFKFRVNMSLLNEQIEVKLQRKPTKVELRSAKEKLNEVFTYISNTFVHIPVNSCIKRHGYNVKKKPRPTLKKIRQRIIRLKPTDNERLLQEAMVYLQEKYGSHHSCETIDLGRLENLYRKLNPNVLKMAREIMKYIPNENLLEPKGCYLATRSLRDAYGQILGIPKFSSLMKLLNPWTKVVD